MPNPDPIKARIEALRGKSGASVQGGTRAETPIAAPTNSPMPSGKLDRAKLEALRGRGSVNPSTTSPNSNPHNFATQKDLEENLPTPQLDAFLDSIVAKA